MTLLQVLQWQPYVDKEPQRARWTPYRLSFDSLSLWQTILFPKLAIAKDREARYLSLCPLPVYFPKIGGSLTTWKRLRIDVLLKATEGCGCVCVRVCVREGSPPILDDSLKAMHGCFMYLLFSVCEEPCLPPRFRFTTGRDGLGDFSAGTEGMRDSGRLQRDTGEPLQREMEGMLKNLWRGKFILGIALI